MSVLALKESRATTMCKCVCVCVQNFNLAKVFVSPQGKESQRVILATKRSRKTEMCVITSKVCVH